MTKQFGTFPTPDGCLLSSMSLCRRKAGNPVLFPLYSFIMLGFESVSVINKRVARIGRGGTQSLDEIRLMLSEKASASFEAATATMLGRTSVGTIARFRERVAENEVRLSAR